MYRKVMKRKKELSGLLEKNGATHHAPLRLEFLFHQTVFITVKIQEPMSPQPEASSAFCSGYSFRSSSLFEVTQARKEM